MPRDPGSGEGFWRRWRLPTSMRTEAVLVLVGVLVAAGSAGAQAASETMELTDRAPPSASASGAGVCSNLQLYGVAEPGEGPDQQTKAYASPSSAAAGCPTLFRGTTPGAFNLTGEVTVQLFVGCDEPTVMHQPLNNVRVWLVRNDVAVSEGQTTLGPVCSPGSPMEARIAIEAPEDPAFGAEDTLGLNVTAFGSPNLVVDNLHVLVGGNETASTLTLPGLSAAYEVEEEAEAAVNGTANETARFANGSGLEQQSSDDANGAPGVGAVATGALLAALALAARRRQW